MLTGVPLPCIYLFLELLGLLGLHIKLVGETKQTEKKPAANRGGHENAREGNFQVLRAS